MRPAATSCRPAIAEPVCAPDSLSGGPTGRATGCRCGATVPLRCPATYRPPASRTRRPGPALRRWDRPVPRGFVPHGRVHRVQPRLAQPCVGDDVGIATEHDAGTTAMFVATVTAPTRLGPGDDHASCSWYFALSTLCGIRAAPGAQQVLRSAPRSSCRSALAGPSRAVRR